MTRNKIGAAALLAVLPLTAVAVAASGADAAVAPQAKITASVSDKTPASGKAFTVSGTFTENNKPAAGQIVKVQTERNGVWSQLTGAKERTTASGKYNIKIILNSDGPRTLRVVGVGQPYAFHPFNVTVH